MQQSCTRVQITLPVSFQVAYIHQHAAERKNTADGDNAKGKPREVLVPLRVPLVDIMRQMEEDPTLLSEPDALSDPLATWMARKYGGDSSLAQLIVQVRQSQETDEEEPSEDEADVLGLFVLLDGLDEAAAVRTTVLSYLGALLAAEPCHFPLLTSRPGIVGFPEQESLATMGFVACLMSPLSQQASRELAASILKRSRESEARVQKTVATRLKLSPDDCCPGHAFAHFCSRGHCRRPGICGASRKSAVPNFARARPAQDGASVQLSRAVTSGKDRVVQICGSIAAVPSAMLLWSREEETGKVAKILTKTTMYQQALK